MEAPGAQAGHGSAVVPARLKVLPTAFFAALFLAILGHLARLALVSPEVQFLMPAADGDWIVHPDPAPGYREAIFVHRFTLSATTEHFPVRITAMRQHTLTVNGQSQPKAAPPAWKSPVEYDLGPLLHAGSNELRVLVATDAPPPALRVEGPDDVRSDERWTVILPLDSQTEVPAAVAYRGERFLTPSPNALRASAAFPTWVWVLVAYCLFIAYALVPLRLKPWRRRTEDADATAPESFWRSRGPCLALLVVVAAIHLRNTSRYPLDHGFDASAHAEYVKYVAERWRAPLANEGWEMSQPPLYYFAGAGIYTLLRQPIGDTLALKAVQLLSPLMTIATLALAWWMLALLFPTRPRMRNLGFAVVALLPVLFYMSPQVTNEVFSAFTIGAAMWLAMRQSARGDLRWRDAVVIGFACGLGLLSKYSGAFVFASVLCIAGLRVLAPGRRIKHLPWALVLAVTTVALSGWLYARNVQTFGTPFIGAWDRRSGFNIVQPPGYRTPVFYERFGAVFWQQPERSRDTSFWDGMYGSLWADSHWIFLRHGDDRDRLASSACLWLALLPSVAILLGFGQALWHLLTREWDHPYFVLVTTTVLTVTSIVSFTMEHPIYSALKAHWALSLAPCAGVFAALGLETMCRQLGRLRWLLYVNLLGLGALVLHLYWYRGA